MNGLGYSLGSWSDSPGCFFVKQHGNRLEDEQLVFTSDDRELAHTVCKELNALPSGNAKRAACLALVGV